MSLNTSRRASKLSVQVGLVSSRSWLNAAQVTPIPRFWNPRRFGLWKIWFDVVGNGLPPLAAFIPHPVMIVLPWGSFIVAVGRIPSPSSCEFWLLTQVGRGLGFMLG